MSLYCSSLGSAYLDYVPLQAGALFPPCLYTLRPTAAVSVIHDFYGFRFSRIQKNLVLTGSSMVGLARQNTLLTLAVFMRGLIESFINPAPSLLTSSFYTIQKSSQEKSIAV